MQKKTYLILGLIFLVSIISAASQGIARERNRDLIPDRQQDNFCGTSSKGSCQIDSDCTTSGCSNSVCQSKNESPSVTTCIYLDCLNKENYNVSCKCIDNKCSWSNNSKQIKKEKRSLNRMLNETDCLANCTCSGSTIKCYKENQTREMIIFAGKSGNIIIQSKGINSSTNLTLYKSEKEGLYFTNKNNKSKKINLLPNQVQEKISEKLSKRLENETIILEENGNYLYKGEEKGKLFALFKIKMKIEARLDSETGELIKINKPWWSFLTKKESSIQIIGSSCSTVTPGYNDECCKQKGYEFYNNSSHTCEFLKDINFIVEEE